MADNIFYRIMFVVMCFTFSGCALHQRIPGLDRIIHIYSKAEVGPIKTETGEVVPGTETESDVGIEPATDDVVASEPENLRIAEESTAPAIAPVKKKVQPQPEKTPSTVKSVKAPTVKPKTTTAKPVVKPVPASPKRVITKAPKNLHKLSGKITVLAKSKTVSPEGVIVRVKRKDGVSLNADTKRTPHEMDMVDKVYAPGNLVIQKGDTVNFINKDKIQHNVFSSSGENAFDLGTFGSGLQRGVRLNEDGIVKVYCNIHPKMAAFVAVDDFSRSTVVDNELGEYHIADLPAGEYELTVWSVRGELKRDLVLQGLPSKTLDLTLDTTNFKEEKRINKYGKRYVKKSIRGEFY